MKRNINKGLRILFSLSFLLSTSIVLGQCPLNIGESTSAPMDNLLLHLPLDNNLDNLGSGSYTMDLSGATYVETQCAQGLSFDGVNDYLSISPTLNLVDDFTISAWISTESQGEWMGIFSIREQCPTTYRGYSIVEFGLGNYDVPTLSNQVNQHLNCTGYSGGDRYTDPSIVIPNSIETFVAVVVENNSSDDRIVKLYVNCIEYDAIMTYDLPSAVCFNNAITYSTTIGATSNVSGLSNTFDGTIDDIRVYDTALSPLQLLDIYQSCLPVAIDVASVQDCSADSALITLYNSQLGVDYQLMDITNNVPIGFPQAGNCAPLLFSTEIVYDTTEFQIIAINSTSNCSIEMDSIITIFPTNGYFYDSNSIVLCSGDSVLIGNQYVSTAGIYNDTILNPSNCDSIISYSMKFENCECNLYIPNAFSPNGDQINDTFYPVSNCIFSYYKLLIFNRWGQLVFESNEPSIQWNGDYKGRKSEIEVYTYILKYAYSFNDIIEQLTGQITLLR